MGHSADGNRCKTTELMLTWTQGEQEQQKSVPGKVTLDTFTSFVISTPTLDGEQVNGACVRAGRNGGLSYMCVTIKWCGAACLNLCTLCK